MLALLADEGLVAYVGVMPHLTRMTEEQIAVLKERRNHFVDMDTAQNWPIQPPELPPFCFGYALFLDIDLVLRT